MCKYWYGAITIITASTIESHHWLGRFE